MPASRTAYNKIGYIERKRELWNRSEQSILLPNKQKKSMVEVNWEVHISNVWNVKHFLLYALRNIVNEQQFAYIFAYT